MILNFNIKAKREKLKTFIDYCIFQITNMFLKSFTPFVSKRAPQTNLLIFSQNSCKISKFKVLWYFDWALVISVFRPPVSFSIHSHRKLLNSQAPDQKSNPQAPDRTYTSISMKTLSKTLEIVTHVFAGAEKHDLTL